MAEKAVGLEANDACNRWLIRLEEVRQKVGCKPGAKEIKNLEMFVNSIVENQGKFIDGQPAQRIWGRYPGLEITTPWMESNKLEGYSALMDHFNEIRDEALQDHGGWEKYKDYTQADGREGLNFDKWTSSDFINDFKENHTNIARFPKTHNILRQIKWARGPLVTFSRLAPQLILPWHSDYYQFIVTFHMAIDTSDTCGLVVGGIPKQIKAGQIETMNSSFLHTSWNLSTKPRIHLLVDFFHPNLPDEEKELLALFFKEGTPASST